MIKLKLFYSYVTELQQIKCNEYGTKGCSVKRVTKFPELITDYS